MRTTIKDIILNSLKTRFFNDRYQALVILKSLNTKYKNTGNIFYCRRITRQTTKCNKNIIKTSYPELYEIY
jgi:hypothetical protein